MDVNNLGVHNQVVEHNKVNYINNLRWHKLKIEKEVLKCLTENKNKKL